MNMNIKLEQLKKVIDDASEEIQKASDAWYAGEATYANADAAYAAYAAAYDACFKAMQELKDYKKESGL